MVNVTPERRAKDRKGGKTHTVVCGRGSLHLHSVLQDLLRRFVTCMRIVCTERIKGARNVMHRFPCHLGKKAVLGVLMPSFFRVAHSHVRVLLAFVGVKCYNIKVTQGRKQEPSNSDHR